MAVVHILLAVAEYDGLSPCDLGHVGEHARSRSIVVRRGHERHADGERSVRDCTEATELSQPQTRLFHMIIKEFHGALLRGGDVRGIFETMPFLGVDVKLVICA